MIDSGTVRVIVRHSSDCRDKEKGTEHKGCTCRKSLLIYDSATKKNKRVSCKTRSWQQAERFYQKYLDSFNPDKIRTKELEAQLAAKDGKQMLIEKAIASYI